MWPSSWIVAWDIQVRLFRQRRSWRGCRPPLSSRAGITPATTCAVYTTLRTPSPEFGFTRKPPLCVAGQPAQDFRHGYWFLGTLLFQMNFLWTFFIPSFSLFTRISFWFEVVDWGRSLDAAWFGLAGCMAISTIFLPRKLQSTDNESSPRTRSVNTQVVGDRYMDDEWFTLGSGLASLPRLLPSSGCALEHLRLPDEDALALRVERFRWQT